jgi:hypothetical protein
MKKTIFSICFFFLSFSCFAESEFPKFLEMNDFFHAKVEYAPDKKADMLAWWNIFGVTLLAANIIFRSFRKFWARSTEPEFFIVFYFISIFACAVPFVLQLFCNIVQFDWRILVALTALFVASILSGMIDFDFLSEEDEKKIYINSTPKISFLILMAIFFGSQFIYF